MESFEDMKEYFEGSKKGLPLQISDLRDHWLKYGEHLEMLEEMEKAFLQEMKKKAKPLP